ncbi:uncharacterized protein DFL_007980 [Arthrobotrys flagrans]|uniref:Uncharacterized protein n=1 Tax=Arthrobotrys flagrans TaxID=97331 RepID=A0A436ZX79_ARTFL|nr:hypothetical protein DFL_007980 [Arthrobotrys flagrans]
MRLSHKTSYFPDCSKFQTPKDPCSDERTSLRCQTVCLTRQSVCMLFLVESTLAAGLQQASANQITALLLGTMFCPCLLALAPVSLFSAPVQVPIQQPALSILSYNKQDKSNSIHFSFTDTISSALRAEIPFGL